ncbi:MAG: helix-turn-helix domain-containing protein [Massiliimalia sp.]|jgi:AraC-like DNA-binding protein
MDTVVRLHYLADNCFYTPWSIPMRKIDDYELLYVTAGSGVLCTPQREFDFSENSLILVPPGLEHSFDSHTLPLKLWCIHFNLYDLGEPQQGMPTLQEDSSCQIKGLLFEEQDPGVMPLKRMELSFPLVTHPVKDPVLLVRLEQMSCFAQKAENSSIKQVERQLTDILEQMQSVSGKISGEKYAKAAAEYIDTHYQENVRLSQLSQILHLDGSYISKLFKAQYGMSISAYIACRRLEEAKKLLRLTDLTMEQVAEQSGFYDASHFHRIFCRQEGKSPGEYRNRL